MAATVGLCACVRYGSGHTAGKIARSGIVKILSCYPIPRPPLLSNIKRSTPNVNGSCRMYKVFKRDILLIASSSEQNKEAAPLLSELAKVLEANSNKSKADCTPLTSYFILRKRYNFVGQQSALLFNYLFSKGVDALISYFKIRPQLFKRWIALSTV